MADSKLETRIKRIERELKKAIINVSVAQAELRDAREIRERLESRFHLAKIELKDERNSNAESTMKRGNFET